MAIPKPSEIYIADLMSQVGYILLTSSYVEQEMMECNSAMEGYDSRESPKKMQQGLSHLYTRWQSLSACIDDCDDLRQKALPILDSVIDDAMQVRNALCHGQYSVTGDPRTNEAFIKTRLSEKEYVHHHADLLQTVANLEIVRWSIRNLTGLALNGKTVGPDAVIQTVLDRLSKAKLTVPPAP